MNSIKLFALALLLPLVAMAAQQPVNVGTTANDHTGDTVRAAMIKLNANDAELYGALIYQISAQNESVPENSAVILRYVFPRVGNFPSNFTSSVAVAGTAATASTVFSIKKNGSQVGTITFAASGTTGIFATSGTVSFAASDLLTIVGPASADATIANLAITLTGTRLP